MPMAGAGSSATTAALRFTAWSDLIEVKHEERKPVDDMWPTDEVIRTREALAGSDSSAE